MKRFKHSFYSAAISGAMVITMAGANVNAISVSADSDTEETAIEQSAEETENHSDSITTEAASDIDVTDTEDTETTVDLTTEETSTTEKENDLEVTEEELDETIEKMNEVTGDGWVYDLTSSGAIITGYTGTETTLVIPNAVDGYKITGIGKRAFAENYKLKSITIPEGITSIGAEAFCGCIGLSTLNFNAKDCTVPSVWKFDANRGNGVFSGAGSASATGLTVNFGEKVTRVPNDLFSTASLDEYGLDGNPYAAVTAVNFSSSITEIGEKAFCSCKDLTKVSLGGNITTIGNWAFYGCSSLTTLATNSKLTNISEKAFAECTSLKTIKWNTNSTLDDIGPRAFEGCVALSTLSIPNSVSTIGFAAFNNCKGLSTLTLPENLTNINGEAFMNCVSLNTININSANLTVPEVWNFGSKANSGIFCGAGSASTIGLKVNFGSTVNYVPNFLFDTASIDEYGHRGSDYAHVTEINFDAAIKGIKSYAFRNCKDLTKLTIGNGISSIDDYAFAECSGLKSISLGTQLSTIGLSAFADCTSLKSITWNQKLNEIMGGAFSGCTALQTLALPDPLTTIGKGAFYNCTGLTTLTLPKSLVNLGPEAFMDTKSLEKLTINSSNLKVPSVWIFDANRGNGVFSGAGSSNLNGIAVTFGSGVTNVPENMFDTASIDEHGHTGNDYAHITSVTLPSSVVSIGAFAFRNCDDLKTISIGSNKMSWGDGLFDDCDSAFTIKTYYGHNEIINYAKENSYKYGYLPPVATTISTAKLTSDGTISLSWKKSKGAKGYEILRKATGDTEWTSIDKVTTLSYTDKTVKAGKTYYYIIKPYVGSVTGKNSEKQAVKYLSKPAISSLTVTTKGIDIEWKKISGATKYRIYRKNDTGNWVKIADTTKLTYSDNTVVSGKSYTYTVKCINSDGTIAESLYNTTGKTAKFVSTPVLSGATNTATGVKVSWGKVSGATKYRLYRKSGTGSWEKVADTTNVSFTDTTAVSGTTYTYTVRCVNADGTKTESAYDKTGKVIMYLSKPVLSGISNTSTGVKISWGKVSGAAKYRVYRKDANGSWEKIATTSSVSYTDTNVVKGTKYTYTVKAIATTDITYSSAFDTTGKTITFK